MSGKPEKCATCQHQPSELWQCSHPACPNRKPITADAPAQLEDGRVPPRINDNH